MPKTIEEFSVNTAKTAIAEDDDHLSALGLLGDMRDNCIHVGQISCVLPAVFKSSINFSGLKRSSIGSCS
jgi:hypothetical protein